MHDIGVGDVAIGKDHHLNSLLRDKALHLLFVSDGYALRIEPASQFGRVAPAGNVGDLGSGEGHNLKLGVMAENDVKVMKVAACRT
jgi:hypothetical protein